MLGNSVNKIPDIENKKHLLKDIFKKIFNVYNFDEKWLKVHF